MSCEPAAAPEPVPPWAAAPVVPTVVAPTTYVSEPALMPVTVGDGAATSVSETGAVTPAA